MPIDSTNGLAHRLKTGDTPFTAIDVDGGAIDGTPIGANSASTGAFSTVSASGLATLSAGATIPDDQVVNLGTGLDVKVGYDATLDAAVITDTSNNIIFKIQDPNSSPYVVAEGSRMEVHRATSTASIDVSFALGLNQTDSTAKPAAEMRSQWTTNTITSEVSRWSVYVCNSGTLAEKLRLDGDGRLNLFGNLRKESSGNLEITTANGFIQFKPKATSGSVAFDINPELTDPNQNSLVRIGRLATPVTGGFSQEFTVYSANTTTKVMNVSYKPGSETIQLGSTTSHKVGFHGATPVVQGSHIADPSGGSTIDSEARTAINSILSFLETRGDLATS